MFPTGPTEVKAEAVAAKNAVATKNFIAIVVVIYGSWSSRNKEKK
jgi:hypothetical protein